MRSDALCKKNKYTLIKKQVSFLYLTSESAKIGTNLLITLKFRILQKYSRLFSQAFGNNLASEVSLHFPAK